MDSFSIYHISNIYYNNCLDNRYIEVCIEIYGLQCASTPEYISLVHVQNNLTGKGKASAAHN